MSLFDPHFYSAAYKDLHGLSVNSLQKHYITNGQKENRITSEKYLKSLYPDVDIYSLMKSNNIDLATAIENIHGHKDASLSEDIVKKPPVQIFDANYYMQQYPDVVAAGYNTTSRAFQHWMTFGRYENRNGSRPVVNTTISKLPRYRDWELGNSSMLMDSSIAQEWFGTHLYGWKGVMTSLYQELKNQSIFTRKYQHDIYFNPWLEELTTWGRDLEKRRQIIHTILDKDVKLITFVHNPPFVEWESKYKNTTPKTLSELNTQIANNPGNFNGLLSQNTDQVLISNDAYYGNCDMDLMDKCIYIYTVSQTHKKYLTSPEIQQKYPFLKNKILSANHPITDNITTRFDYNSYTRSNNKKIYHIGWWMRNLKTFNDIKLPVCLNKNVLVKKDFSCFTDIITPAMKNVTFVGHLEDNEYVKIFKENILYMDAFDVTASNLLLECIRCETPVILNRHPSFEQYIGAKYPMFYDDISDIECLTVEQFNKLVQRTNDYLKKLDKTHISQRTFNQKICYDLKKLENDNSLVKLSWITSLYNADKYFSDFCKDFTNQNYKHPEQLELIIVNIYDSHSKETQKKIVEFEKTNHNVKLINISKEKDPGIYKCWEIAIKQSIGRYITNANLDDRHHPDFSMEMINYMDSTPTVDVTYAPVYVGSKYLPVYKTKYLNSDHVWFAEREIGQPLHISDLWDKSTKDTRNPCHSCPVWRRDIHEIVGYFNEEMYGSVADYALWLKCIDMNLNIAKGNSKPLAFYLINNRSYGRTKNVNTKKQFLLKQYNLNIHE